ncbi:ENTH-domain-containing protein [Laetiporus sulphureus 93-53]|uniref:ENTH-domain-containing protein n=1 Tax=Laetiporus sulphureus 93-53 TaxID=1314785 RepID=A0A165C2B5_9APHY|nr:ENTH-domain-containing protein [Laetiporus sulphureus 93-53]KZT02072.1 ENTH-domain-containing protein [Laetiporus sulphureus 93-53]
MTSTLTHYGKGALRVAKNYTKGYTHTQAKVRDATSNDPWPPSGRQMHEIAQLTFNPEDFVEIMEMMDKRLNDKGKNWRHVFKALTLLDYLLHSGSENVILYFRDNLYVVKTLREFQYVDDNDQDQGANVRLKAREIVNLMQDEGRLRHERRTRARMYERMGHHGWPDDSDDTDEESGTRRSGYPPVIPTRPLNKEDEDVRRAIEESKRSMEHDRATAEERDLQKAIQLSKEEEEKRAKQLAEANLILFDEQGQARQQPQQTGILVDATLPLQYAVTGVQPQYTAMPLQSQYTAMPLQAQYTSFNPFQQQAEQEMLQAQYMQQQQAEMVAMQQAQEVQALQQAQLQAQQEEWMRQQQLLAQQQQAALLPQPTAVRIGSNNPFASSVPPRDSVSAGPQLQQTTGTVSFNLTGTYANRENTASAPLPSLQQRSYTGRPTRTDQQHSRLADLFANRGEDGVDTFGNVGQLRFMSTEAGRVVAQKTGPATHNPFVQHTPSQQNDASLIQF